MALLMKLRDYVFASRRISAWADDLSDKNNLAEELLKIISNSPSERFFVIKDILLSMWSGSPLV